VRVTEHVATDGLISVFSSPLLKHFIAQNIPPESMTVVSGSENSNSLVGGSPRDAQDLDFMEVESDTLDGDGTAEQDIPSRQIFFDTDSSVLSDDGNLIDNSHKIVMDPLRDTGDTIFIEKDNSEIIVDGDGDVSTDVGMALEGAGGMGTGDQDLSDSEMRVAEETERTASPAPSIRQSPQIRLRTISTPDRVIQKRPSIDMSGEKVDFICPSSSGEGINITSRIHSRSTSGSPVTDKGVGVNVSREPCEVPIPSHLVPVPPSASARPSANSSTATVSSASGVLKGLRNFRFFRVLLVQVPV
jgi:hypothetical protein